MSATCQADGCYTPILEDRFACPKHRARISWMTWQRLTSYYDANDFLSAFQQAQVEMRSPAPRLIRGVA